MISKNKARLSKQAQAQKPKPDNEKSHMDGLDNIKPPSISMDENNNKSGVVGGGFPQEPNKIGF